MSLDYFINKSKELTAKHDIKILNNIGVFGTVGDWLCLEEFLQLLAKNPAILAQFRELLNTLVTSASSAKAALQLLISQLETLNSFFNLVIQNYRGTASTISGQVGVYKLDAFATCRTLQGIKKGLKSILPNDAPKFSNTVIGKKYQQTTRAIKEVEMRVIRNLKRIRNLERSLKEIDAWIDTWTMIIGSIDEQFGDVLNPPESL